MLNIELVLYNARLTGAGPGYHAKGLVALSGGRIAAVTTNDQLAEFKRSGTKIIDCEGGTLLPGFHDAHLHLYSMVHRELGIDLSPKKVNSIEELQAVLRNRASNVPNGSWVRGQGYDDFYLGRHPTRHDLDAAVNDHPVVITHRSLHACVLNSSALKLVGIGDAIEELPEGTIDLELETGAPSGLIFEMTSVTHKERMPPPNTEEFNKGLRRVSEYLVSHGVTSIQDAGIGNSPARYQELRDHIDHGDIKCRLTMMASGHLLEDFNSQGFSYNHGDHRLRLGAAKFVLNEVGDELEPSEEELNHLVQKACLAGFPVAIHAIGETAVAAATCAIGCATKFRSTALRHRIEHASECTPTLIKQIRDKGVTVVSQPSFLYHSGERYLTTVDKETLPYLYPYRSLLATGVPVVGSSDSPVVPADPLAGIYAAVTRRTTTGSIINPPECISISAALRLFTVGGAYAAGEEHIKGTLTPGKLGDLVLLDKNPRTVDPEEILEIKVLLTVIGGKVVWGM